MCSKVLIHIHKHDATPFYIVIVTEDAVERLWNIITAWH